MAQVFLSHKSEETAIALQVKEFLQRCLISVWLDSDNLQGGAGLSPSILAQMAASRYFVPLISSRYVRSNWCLHELEEAQNQLLNDQIKVIPVLLEPKEKLGLNELSPGKAAMLNSILSRNLYLSYDSYDQQQSCIRIANTIGSYNKIQFAPVVTKSLGGVDLQVIQFEITADDGNLPSILLSEWQVEIEREFLSYHDNDEKARPLIARKPVAISGKGPNWLCAYISTQFKNLCPVYVFNNKSNEYICVYDNGIPSSHLGRVISGG